MIDEPREQARIRQARKRQRDRVDRITVQADAAAEKLPLGWRVEFLEVVRKARARAEGALVEVEKAARLFPDGPLRHQYLKSNYKYTKVSISRLLSEFIRQKTKIARAAAVIGNELLGDYNHYEYVDPDDVDWTDLNELAMIIGDEVGPEAPLIGTCFILLNAAAKLCNSLTGALQARELLSVIDEVVAAIVALAFQEEPLLEERGHIPARQAAE